MSTCHASSIVFDGRTLSWFGPEGASWSVPVDRLRAICELVVESGDVRWLVEFDIDGEGAALQAPANADGMDRALAALSGRLTRSSICSWSELRRGADASCGCGEDADP